jgi:hypothetical protein
MLLGTSALSSAQSSAPAQAPLTRIASFASGSIHGLVRDEAGSPVGGATVSALGSVNAFATTDRNGRYELRALTPGSYAVRAHLSGYAASRTQIVEVRSSARTPSYISLRRARSSPKIVPAAVGLPPAADVAPEKAPATPDAAEAAAPVEEGEIAWRLRHPQRRSILRNATLPGDIWVSDRGESNGLGRVFNGSAAAAKWASTFFADSPLSGEVNFLTTGWFDSPQQLFSSEIASKGIAHLSVSAPLGTAEWNVRGSITQADISSWVLAGSYKERSTNGHQYHLGMSYSTQRYDGGNLLTLRDVANGSRNVGEIFAFDTISLTPTISANYGVRYGRYDYLLWRDLFSPRAEVIVAPSDDVRISALLSRRALAPGAEEFLPPAETGLWLPPQRTFSALEPGRPLGAEYTTHTAVAAERDFGRSTIGLRGFYQRIDDQLVTLFDTVLADDPVAKVGHYQVGSGGDARAIGVAANVETTFSRWVKAGLEYSTANAILRPDQDLRYVVLQAPVGFDGQAEQIHNLSGSVEADIPETATRVQVLYRLSNAFTEANDTPVRGISTRAVIGSRFDVQFRQALPFMNFSAAKWEMLLAVRNFVREPGPDQSVYDELLVVRPPKRVVGGLTLLF